MRSLRHAVVAVGACIAVAGAGGATARQADSHCTDASSACLSAVAHSYVDALASNDPAKADAVRAAPDVQKWENGVHNATSRPELVAAIKATQVLVAGIRDLRLYPERGGHAIFAVYLADGGVGPVSLTSHVMERLEVRHGLITSLEIVECTGGPAEEARPPGKAPAAALDFALCARGPRLPSR